MENFKIYKDGQYATIENIKFKAHNLIQNQIHRIDHFLEKY
jgi:hypothetical protein